MAVVVAAAAVTMVAVVVVVGRVAGQDRAEKGVGLNVRVSR